MKDKIERIKKLAKRRSDKEETGFYYIRTKRVNDSEIMMFEDERGRPVEVCFHYDYDRETGKDVWMVEVIYDGVVDFAESYTTEEEYREVLSELFKRYPELREYADLFGYDELKETTSSLKTLAMKLRMLARKLEKLAPRAPRREPPEAIRREIEEILREPVPVEERRIRIAPGESIIVAGGRYEKILNELLRIIEELMKQKKELEKRLDELMSLLDRVIEEKFHIVLKRDITVEEVMEMLKEAGEKLGSLERIVVVAGDKILRLRDQVRLVLKPRKFAIEIEERLREILGAENEELFRRVLDTIKEYLSATEFYVREIRDLTDEIKEAIERERTETASIEKESQFKTIWEKISNLFRKFIRKAKEWLGIVEETEGMIEEAGNLAEEIADELEYAFGD